MVRSCKPNSRKITQKVSIGYVSLLAVTKVNSYIYDGIKSEHKYWNENKMFKLSSLNLKYTCDLVSLPSCLLTLYATQSRRVAAKNFDNLKTGPIAQFSLLIKNEQKPLNSCLNKDVSILWCTWWPSPIKKQHISLVIGTFV